MQKYARRWRPQLQPKTERLTSNNYRVLLFGINMFLLIPIYRKQCFGQKTLESYGLHACEIFIFSDSTILVHLIAVDGLLLACQYTIHYIYLLWFSQFERTLA